MKNLTEEQKVRKFLLNEKDFFVRNEDLLCLLRLSHPNTRGSVSLLERQNKLLRKSLDEIREELGSVKQIAQKNHETLNKVFDWILKLSFVADEKKNFSVFLKLTREIFNLDIVSLLLISELRNETQSTPKEKPSNTNKELLSKIKNIEISILANPDSEFKYWKNLLSFGRYSYAKASKTECASMIVLPLRRKKGGQARGVLILGSTKAKRFDERLGIFFLEKISEVSSLVTLAK